MSDADFLDHVLDRAEEKLAAEASTVEPKEPPVKELVEKAEPEQPEIVEKPEALPEVESAEEVDADKEALSAIEPPAFWSNERKTAFASASPELQKIITEREKELQAHISRLGNEAGKARGYEKRFYEDFENINEAKLHISKLRAKGVSDPIEELHRYRAWDRTLEEDPKTVIATLMQRNGLTPEHFMGYETEEDQVPQEDPRLTAAERKAEEALTKLQEIEDRQTRAVIESWKDQPDAQGVSRRAFSERYAADIARAYDAILANNPGADMLAVMTAAYDHVKSDVLKFHGVASTGAANAQKSAQDLQKISQISAKAKKAAMPAFGGPRVGQASGKSKLKGKTFDEKLDAALDLAEERLYA
jgi:hypothetical protein